MFVSKTPLKSNISQSFKTVTLNVIEKTFLFFFFNINLLNDLNEKEVIYILSKRYAY